MKEAEEGLRALGERTQYRVVVNHEAQCSIWPTYKPLPQGWLETTFSGDKTSCLAHIEQRWQDLRESSLQQWLAGLPIRKQEAS